MKKQNIGEVVNNGTLSESSRGDASGRAPLHTREENRHFTQPRQAIHSNRKINSERSYQQYVSEQYP